MQKVSAVLLLSALASSTSAQVDPSLLASFTWRSVGPDGAGGRVVDVDVVGEEGVTWEPLFDDVHELEGPAAPGLHRVQWDLRHPAPPTKEGETGGFRGPLRGPLAEPGTYTLRVEIGDRRETTALVVEPDPELEAPETARARRWETVQRAFDLHEASFETAATSERLADALESFSEQSDDLPEPVREPLSSLDEDAAALAHRAGRTRELAADLYREVETSPFEPTDTQSQRLEELRARHETEGAELSTLLEERLAALERLLEENGVPRIRFEREEVGP